MKKHIVITGHYGVGKTNVAVNLALSEKEKKCCLIDLDIVNPYFRSADDAEILEKNGVRCVIPTFANTNLDIPVLPAEIQSVFFRDERVIWDVGGDSDGAAALGRFSEKIASEGYEMYSVVNFQRPMTPDAESALEMINGINLISRLKTTGIINNTNLGDETDVSVIKEGIKKATELSEISGLPIITTCAPEFLREEKELSDCFFIASVTKKFW